MDPPTVSWSWGEDTNLMIYRWPLSRIPQLAVLSHPLGIIFRDTIVFSRNKSSFLNDTAVSSGFIDRSQRDFSNDNPISVI